MGYATVDVMCACRRCIPQKAGGNQAVPFLCGCADPKIKKPWLALGAVWLGFNGAAALAQPAPLSLDQALKDTLGLETTAGCPPGFGDPVNNPGNFGPQLTAICEPRGGGSTSAAALGGSLGSLQTTKTASQFRLARRRVDSGLRPLPKRPPGGKRFGLSGSTLLANPDQPSRLNNFSVFTQLEYEWRDRARNPLEASYEAKISEGLIGFDFVMPNKLLVGAWVGYGNIGADYTGTNLGTNQTIEPTDLFNLCGRLSVSGGFNDVGVKLGGFVAGRFGRGYGDVVGQYSNRDYDYHRNSCVIRANKVFAGTLSGQTTRTEGSVSARTGYDFGNERFLWGPRVSLTYVTSKIDAFTEAGQASVVILGPDGLPTAGNSTGLELAL